MFSWAWGSRAGHLISAERLPVVFTAAEPADSSEDTLHCNDSYGAHRSLTYTGHCWPEKNSFIPLPSVSYCWLCLFVLRLHRLHPIKLFNKHTARSPIKNRESHLCCEVLWRRAADIIYIWSSSVVFVKWNNMCKQRENSREQRSHARHPVLHTWAQELWKNIPAKTASMSSALPQKHLVNY